MIQISDMFSDIFFAAEVCHYLETTKDRSKFIIILSASILFIITPVIISLYQLHRASSKHWLNENKSREWLLTNGKYLYLFSVITGSSFSAVSIFNCINYNTHDFLFFSSLKCTNYISNPWYYR